jgi:hypothetical protein
MSKPKRNKTPHYRTHDLTRGMDYLPVTPPGKTALEHQGRGSFRPGKTARDWSNK